MTPTPTWQEEKRKRMFKDAATVRRRARRSALITASHRFWALAAKAHAEAEKFANQQRTQSKTVEESMAVEMDDAYLTYQHAARLCEQWAKEAK